MWFKHFLIFQNSLKYKSLVWKKESIQLVPFILKFPGTVSMSKRWKLKCNYIKQKKINPGSWQNYDNYIWRYGVSFHELLWKALSRESHFPAGSCASMKWLERGEQQQKSPGGAEHDFWSLTELTLKCSIYHKTKPITMTCTQMFRNVKMT